MYNFAIKGLMDIASPREAGDSTSPIMQSDFSLPNAEPVVTPINDPDEALLVDDAFVLDANFAIDGLMQISSDRESGFFTRPLMQGDYMLPGVMEIYSSRDVLYNTTRPQYSALGIDGSMLSLWGAPLGIPDEEPWE